MCSDHTLFCDPLICLHNTLWLHNEKHQSRQLFHWMKKIKYSKIIRKLQLIWLFDYFFDLFKIWLRMWSEHTLFCALNSTWRLQNRITNSHQVTFLLNEKITYSKIIRKLGLIWLFDYLFLIYSKCDLS